MKKLIFIISSLLVLSSCIKETINAKIEEQSIMVYNKQYIDNTSFVKNDEFYFLCQDTSKIYFSKLSTTGTYSEILNITDYLQFKLDTFSLVKMLHTQDDGIIVFAYFSDMLNYSMLKFNSNYQFEWQTNDTSDLMTPGIDFQEVIQYSNGNISLVYKKIVLPPENNDFKLKEKIYNGSTGSFIESSLTSFSNCELISIYKYNSGFYMFTTTKNIGHNLNNYPLDSIGFIYKDGQNITTLKTDISTSSKPSVIINNNLIYLAHTDAVQNLRITCLGINEGIIWNKPILLASDTLQFETEKVVVFTDEIYVFGWKYNTAKYQYKFMYSAVSKQGELLNANYFNFNMPLYFIDGIFKSDNNVVMLCEEFSYYNDNYNICLLKSDTFSIKQIPQ